MDHLFLPRILTSLAVSEAVGANRPVVALESTVIAHGLPRPHNLELALECEAIVSSVNSLPATIGIIDGVPTVGLDRPQLDEMAARSDVAKVNLSNLAQVMNAGGWGATTVAASLLIASGVGLKVFATGGIGGVHRGAESSFDISADLTALSRFPVITVCAGAKAILDLHKTMEVLETLGVPVIGYGTDELPAFYSRESGIGLDITAGTAEDVANLAMTHWEMGSRSSVLVVAPVPETDAIPAHEIQGTIDEALAEAQSISGKSVTPYLLRRIAEKTEGRSLKANLALLKNNARLAGKIAEALSTLL